MILVDSTGESVVDEWLSFNPSSSSEDILLTHEAENFGPDDAAGR